MKPIIYGALLGVLWLTTGLPLTAPVAVLAAFVQPVTVAFAAGLLAAAPARRGRWTR
ncbi:hypothetical protein ABZ490_25950 [Streptomyces sp. NPDC005811]|uniref:hypothetical protein n=1 Tax=Streptomyces sp. NPDC005811 TaxID=3154565 RepID=UPI0033F21524